MICVQIRVPMLSVRPLTGWPDKREFEQPTDPAEGEQADDRRHAQAHYQSDQRLRVHGASPQFCLLLSGN